MNACANPYIAGIRNILSNGGASGACGENYGKMKVSLNWLLHIQRQRNWSLHYLTPFNLGIYVILFAHSNVTHHNFAVTTTETHLELRCQYRFMLFTCSNFLPCSFKSCLQCCDLASKITSNGLNGKIACREANIRIHTHGVAACSYAHTYKYTQTRPPTHVHIGYVLHTEASGRVQPLWHQYYCKMLLSYTDRQTI